MFKSKIPVFMASDDNYAPFLCTTIYSMLANTKSFCAFHVLDGGISENSKRLIAESLKKFNNFEISYVDMSSYGLNRFPNIKHYSVNAFSRYFIPEIATGLGKVIYMDIDVIVKGDIAELYKQKLDEYCVAAVLEDFADNYVGLKTEIYPEYNGGDKYFNSGVMLLDTKKFIKNNYMEKLVDLTVKLHDKLLCADQDVFNILFENNFKILDYKYNYMPDYAEKLKTKHPEITKVEPLIIHYTSQKPWKSNQGAMAADFNEILKQTAFAEYVKKKYFLNTVQTTYTIFGFIPLLKVEEKIL